MNTVDFVTELFILSSIISVFIHDDDLEESLENVLFNIVLSIVKKLVVFVSFSILKVTIPIEIPFNKNESH